uniref:Secreted protein n=1 Tax=Knipowitschia caucasica TaxID=637954 RepID=A0AAV2JEB6_KNICA
MSLKAQLVSVVLCCVYGVASLFCLHPNRNNSVSVGARSLTSILQHVSQRFFERTRSLLGRVWPPRSSRSIQRSARFRILRRLIQP